MPTGPGNGPRDMTSGRGLCRWYYNKGERMENSHGNQTNLDGGTDLGRRIFRILAHVTYFLRRQHLNAAPYR